MNLADFMAKYNLSRGSLESISGIGTKVATILFLGYVTATVASSILVGTMIKVMTKPAPVAGRASPTDRVFTMSQPNYRELRKAIMDRNVFNSEGKFPEEKDVDSGKGKSVSNAFDMNAPCTKSKLEVQLLGTIYLGNRLTSLATMKDKDYPEADIYRVGDAVIGQDQAVIAAVERQRVIINNGGTKECIELVIKGPEGAGSSLPPESGAAVASSAVAPAAGGGEALEGCSNVALEGTYVEQQLGQGFQNIITKARLVPNTAEGKVSGFKIFAIDQSSLFGKLCLQNNDVIVQVNETSLQQPEQGFALFEAFQNEKDIRISILRNSQPRTITVHIK